MFRLLELKKDKMTVRHVFDYLRVQQRKKWRPVLSPQNRHIKTRPREAYSSSNEPNQANKFPSTIGSNQGRLASSGFINSSSSGALQQYTSYANEVQGNNTLSSQGFYSSGGI